jgi:CheY-like chemotaxis protein
VPGIRIVLIVDDEPLVLDLHVDHFEMLGFNTVSTHRPEEALDLLADRKQEFHLLFTDIQMPRMNGCELAEKARAIRPALKVILTSGLTRPTIQAPFLAKPYEPAALAYLVTKTMAA